MTAFFRTNEGTIDRVLRIVVGLALLSLTVVGPKTLWGLVGLVPLLTGIAGTCPLYSVFGLSTCPMKSNKTATQN
ncbi:MAG: DUF2892 domain-containing protein [Thermoanaerobaculia bacterium]